MMSGQHGRRDGMITAAIDLFDGRFLFAQRSWQTQSLLVSDLALFMGKRIRMVRASSANVGV